MAVSLLRWSVLLLVMHVCIPLCRRCVLCTRVHACTHLCIPLCRGDMLCTRVCECTPVHPPLQRLYVVHVCARTHTHPTLQKPCAHHARCCISSQVSMCVHTCAIASPLSCTPQVGVPFTPSLSGQVLSPLLAPTAAVPQLPS